ncbi:hypothetical protein F753_15890 [Stutzerimonas chloritidismutans AW-1]|uniref:FMN hydroxy acid dehydrogenase domain-containing protein n=1 Tax=Stutzerimonas chloritidismutans AW-1 TaxID=1263865 RepID=V4PQF2_STUCH|nr:L-lactate dehydrogenase [Stutzerimonas chloritidismutans]ESQ98380.1 hypothetical protein F753_15890 [Stutzerimonas chloritidismutans AW-1]
MTYNVVPATSRDYRRLADKALPRFLFDYIDGGANDELTLARNVSDFARITLKHNVLRDVSRIDTATTLAGERAAMPVILAPVGLAGMFKRRGEVQGVRAANRVDVPFTLSTVGICPVDEVARAAEKPFWFQLYMVKDRKAVQGLLERAMAAGCQTLVFTVDLPVAGMRHRDTRNGLFEKNLRGALMRGWQVMTRPGWVYDVGMRGKPHAFGNYADLVSEGADLNAYKEWVDNNYDNTVTWKDIEWVRTIWKGRILIKGILEGRDAQSAVDVGADGIVVSNHGARQLDSVSSTIRKLPEVVAAVGDKTEVFMDGGVRGGLDVLQDSCKFGAPCHRTV